MGHNQRLGDLIRRNNPRDEEAVVEKLHGNGSFQVKIYGLRKYELTVDSEQLTVVVSLRDEKPLP